MCIVPKSNPWVFFSHADNSIVCPRSCLSLTARNDNLKGIFAFSLFLLVSLKNHIRTVHEVRRDWKCVSCEKEFAHSKDLKSHIKKVHESEPRKSPKIAKKSKSSKNAKSNIKKVIKTEIKVEGNDVYIRS